MNEEETILDDQENHSVEEEKLSQVVTVLSFCFPIVGAIVYFNHKNSQPQKAQTACNAALWGFGVGVIIRIITMATGGDF